MQTQGQVLRQEQRLRMTPQLYLAIKIMALPIQDLRLSIAQEVETNPALEVVEDKTTISLDDSISRSTQAEEERYFDDTSDPGFGRTRSTSDEDAKRSFIEGVLTRPESLQEHLLQQLRVQPISPDLYSIGELLIRNLDANGFHREPVETLVDHGTDVKLLEAAAELIRTFDPVGTCTSGYQESLLVQVRLHPAADPGSRRIVEEYWDLAERGKLKEIARKLKTDEDEVKAMLEFIRELDPIPGRNFFTDSAKHVIPDIMVKVQDGQFVIVLNDEEIPVLGVNPFFEDLVEDKEKRKEKEAKKFARSRVQDARWYIRSIQQRNQTLLKVSKAIVEFQREFFRRGPKYLMPLTLKDVAAEVGVHEATVSRITTSKYMQTEWGLFGLKYFFSNSISGSGSSGSRYSKGAVKEIVREIVEKEEGHLSDQKIALILANRGISIARRTVAKYRKELDIVSSYRR